MYVMRLRTCFWEICINYNTVLGYYFNEILKGFIKVMVSVKSYYIPVFVFSSEKVKFLDY